MAGAGAWIRPLWYGKTTMGTTIQGVDAADKRRQRMAAQSIEQELKNQGFLSEGVKPDGIFRDTTDKAIREFQRRHGLDDDGAAGRLTLRELFKPIVLWEEVAGRIVIPGHYLHGQISLESDYDPGAEGTATENGIDRGMVQLNDKSYPGLTPDMIYSNPRMCVAIGAARMREARRRETDVESYGDKGMWKCAILDHNWPVAADHLYDTGEWLLTEQEKKDGVAPEQAKAAKYVNRVISRGLTF
jgi:Putative peptidoglycan binding domain